MAVDTSVGREGGPATSRGEIEEVLKAVKKLEVGLADKIESVTQQRDELREVG